jgi:hypothetical protein
MIAQGAPSAGWCGTPSGVRFTPGLVAESENEKKRYHRFRG